MVRNYNGLQDGMCLQCHKTVGVYYYPDGSGHGFLLKNGELRAIDRPGCIFTAASAIDCSFCPRHVGS